MVKKLIRQQCTLQMDDFEEHCNILVMEEMNLGTATDCIIWAQGKKFFCHRLILSFASPFLKTLLDTSTTPTPVILLPDVSAEALGLIINIIYTGECTIPKHMRYEVLELCSALQLKGVEGLSEDTTLNAGLDSSMDEEAVDFDLEPGEIGDPVEEEEELHTFDEAEDDEMHDETQNADTEMIFVDANGEQISQRTRSNVSPGHTMTLKRKDPTAESRNLFAPSQSSRIRLVKTNSGLEIETSVISPKAKIEIDAEQKEQLMARLIHLIKKTYQHLNTRGREKLVDLNHKEKLVMRGNVLMKGNFNCVLCEKDIAVVYTTDKKGRFKQWINSNMKRHLRRVHKDLHDPVTSDMRQLGMYGTG